MAKRLFVALALAGVFLLALANIAAAQPKYEARMYGMTGLAGKALGFSLGVNTVLGKVSAKFPTVKTYSRTHWQSRAVYETAKANYRIDKLPIILLGHSLGADAISDIANWLKADAIPVAAVFYYDPTPLVECVPANVQVALGWHNTALFQLGQGVIKPCPGFKGDLEEEGVRARHVVIDDLPQLHASTLKRVGDVVQMIREMKGTK